MYRESVLTLNLALLLWASSYQGQCAEQKLQASILFWTEAVCKVPTTKTVYFHGIFRNTSTTLLNYFETLIQGIGDLCDVTVLSKMYEPPKDLPDALAPQDYRDPISNANGPMAPARPAKHTVTGGDARRSALLREILTENLLQKPAGVRKIARINYGSVVDMWNINIIFLEDNRFLEQVLQTQAPFSWSRQEHFLVFAIWSKEFEKRTKDTQQVIRDILWKFWRKYRIHNVFFNEPLTGHIHRGYTFNPMSKVDDTTWGKVEIIDTSSQFDLFSTLAHLTRQRTRNLEGRLLKVSLFETDSLRRNELESATVAVRRNTAGYSGMDAIIMSTMSKHMNFTVVEVAPTGGGRFGHQMDNGTYTGAIADIANRVVDVCFVAFFVKRYGENMDIMEFSTYVDFDKVCVIVPKAHKIPKGLRIYHIFQPSVWCFVILSQLLLQLAWYYVQILSARREKKKVDFQLTMLKAFLVYTGYSMKLPRSTAERVILLGVFISSITLMGTFNGLLYKSFAKDIYYKDITYLSELDASGMPILVNSPSMYDLFGVGDDPEEPIMSSLRRKMIYGHSSLRFTAYYRNASALMRQYTFPLVKEAYVAKDGTRLVHLVPECPGYYYLSYVLPKHSILFPRFVALLGRMNQAGLTELWKRRTLLTRARKMNVNIEDVKFKESTDFVPFTLSDTQTCFSLLAAGLTMSVVAFFHEKGWLRRCFRCEIKPPLGKRPEI